MFLSLTHVSPLVMCGAWLYRFLIFDLPHPFFDLVGGLHVLRSNTTWPCYLRRQLSLKHIDLSNDWKSKGAQWLSGRVLDSRPRGRGFEPHRRHCVVSLSKHINPSLVLVQPWKTRPFITERLLTGRKESNQTNKTGKVSQKNKIRSGLTEKWQDKMSLLY